VAEIRITHWAQWKRHKYPNPPWFAWPSDFIDLPFWIGLDDPARSLVIALMTLAARHDNRVPCDLDYIHRAGHLHQRPHTGQ